MYNVCQTIEVSSAGEVLRSFGGERGDGPAQLNWPWYVVLDPVTNDCLIADRNNHRAVHLDPELRPTGVVISSPQGPTRLCLAADRLMVAHSNRVNVYALR